MKHGRKEQQQQQQVVQAKVATEEQKQNSQINAALFDPLRKTTKEVPRQVFSQPADSTVTNDPFETIGIQKEQAKVYPSGPTYQASNQANVNQPTQQSNDQYYPQQSYQASVPQSANQSYSSATTYQQPPAQQINQPSQQAPYYPEAVQQVPSQNIQQPLPQQQQSLPQQQQPLSQQSSIPQPAPQNLYPASQSSYAVQGQQTTGYATSYSSDNPYRTMSPNTAGRYPQPAQGYDYNAATQQPPPSTGNPGLPGGYQGYR